MIQLKVGDEVRIGCNGRGGHGARIEITKINRKSIKGVETKGSYKAGMEWTLCSGIEIAHVTYDGERAACMSLDGHTDGKIVGLMRLKWGTLGEKGTIA